MIKIWKKFNIRTNYLRFCTIKRVANYQKYFLLNFYFNSAQMF